jgi:hypothetical protein
MKDMSRTFVEEMMVSDRPILCPVCGKTSGYTENGVMFLVVSHDLHCQHCGAVVVHGPTIWNTMQEAASF